jgi:SSS family solute:Na+ symporter
MTDDLWVLTRTDWIVITLYLVAMLGLGVVLSRRQKSGTSFLVGDRRHGAVPVAISVLATQCSTNSILGAPAFIAFSVGGGLVWLQYELALPFAMIVVLLLLYPVFRRQQLTSIYSYLENRFDRSVRLALSGVFQLIRCLATAVTLYWRCFAHGPDYGIVFFFVGDAPRRLYPDL